MIQSLTTFLVLFVATVSFAAPQPWRLEEKRGIWSFISPEGEPFWSFGVCCVDPGIPWDTYNPENRSYSGFRLFTNAAEWANSTRNNLKGWGFNSLGGWSRADLMTNRQAGEDGLPWFLVLHLGAYYRAPWNDLFSPEAAKAIDDAARAQIEPVLGDTRLIGYFTDNELGWWDDTLFLHYLAMPPEAPGRQRLMAVLRGHYRNDFAALQIDWVSEATSWDELEAGGTLAARAGRNGIRVVRSWTYTIARHYYTIVRDAVRRYDPDRLILGDRYLQYYDLEVVRASVGLVDANSTNLGAHWLDGTLAPFYLETLYRMTGRPTVITEFYSTAEENRSGLQNDSAGAAFPVVQTQVERTQLFRRFMETLLGNPSVIGAHWFQFYDHPEKGRGDGENYNMGLVDIEGRPYEELTAATAGLDIPAFRENARREPESESIPLFEDPASGLAEWPRAEARRPQESDAAFGDLFTVWRPDGVWLGVFTFDFIDERLYENGVLPQADRPHLVIRVGDREFTVRYGGKDQEATSSPKLEVIEQTGLRHTLLIRLPAEAFGRSRLAAGERVQFSVTAVSQSAAEMMQWNTDLTLAP